MSQSPMVIRIARLARPWLHSAPMRIHRSNVLLSSVLLLSACGSSGGGGGGGGGDASADFAMPGGGGTPDLAMGGGGDAAPPANCGGGGAEITAVPPCANAGMATTVDVPRGCAPTVDGTLHASEWSDGACFVAGNGGGALTIRMKYAGDALYLAASGDPTCGCGMPFHFDPDGGMTLEGDEFLVILADDPFGADGDRSDFVAQNGKFTMGSAPAGIVTAGPPNMPAPVRSEWKIPLADLGITPGQAHTFRFAVNHAGQTWPATLQLAQSSNFSSTPATWGQVLSSTSWK